MKILITTVLLFLSISVSAGQIPNWMKPAMYNGKQFTCSKRYCKQMDSCSEAHFHWKNCPKGEKRDGDDDGIPCENVCGKTISAMKQRLQQGR